MFLGFLEKGGFRQLVRGRKRAIIDGEMENFFFRLDESAAG